jgi:hypothetical protein
MAIIGHNLSALSLLHHDKPFKHPLPLLYLGGGLNRNLSRAIRELGKIERSGQLRNHIWRLKVQAKGMVQVRILIFM